MSFTPLRIVISLGSPLYLTGEPIHLDALLAFERVRHEPGQSHGPHVVAWEPTEAEEVSLPLAIVRSGGNWWYRASACFIEGGARSRQFWGKRFDRDHLGEIAMGKATQLVTTLGPFKDMKVPVECVHVSELVFYAVGERARVRDGLRRMRYIGKKASQGYGLVADLSVEALAGTEDAFELDLFREDRGPARNVPAEWARGRGVAVEGEMRAPLRPPYWRQADAVSAMVAR